MRFDVRGGSGSSQKKWKVKVELETSNKIKESRSDNAGELKKMF
jgi:hypothetical protein